MIGKDCDNRMTNWRLLLAAALAGLVTPSGVCLAGSVQTVRMWPSAVVVADEILVGDLCELTSFDDETHQRLRTLVIAPSPPPAGSKAISLRELRRVLTGAGINMAQTIVKGAAECGVRRPRVLPDTPVTVDSDDQLRTGPSDPAPVTLRDSVIEHFEKLLARYRGRVYVEFGRTAAAMLDLSGPEFEFSVRRRSGRQLGLIDVTVEVRRDGRLVQEIEVLANVTFSRDVVVARRAINQKAEIRPTDVQLNEMTFDDLDRLGMADLSQAIGQRAKKFVPAGRMLELRDLETVPLVKRGQLVEVHSTVGATTIRTAAKAVESGSLGELVELRSADNKRRTLLGKVTGPRRVELHEGGGTGSRYGERRVAVAGATR